MNITREKKSTVTGIPFRYYIAFLTIFSDFIENNSSRYVFFFIPRQQLAPQLSGSQRMVGAGYRGSQLGLRLERPDRRLGPFGQKLGLPGHHHGRPGQKLWRFGLKSFLD